MAEKPEKIDYKYNLKLYLSLLKNYKLYIFALIIVIIIIESINASTRFLFSIIVDKASLYVAGTLAKDKLIQIFVIIAAVYLGTVIVRAISRWFYLHFINRLEGNLIIDLKKRFFNHIVGLSHSFHTTHRTGSMISRLTRGGRAVERMTDLLMFNVIPMIIQTTIVLVSLAYFDATSAIVIAIMATLFIGYSYLMQRVKAPYNLAANNAEDYEKGMIADFFTNIDSIKNFGKEKHIQKKYDEISGASKRAQLIDWDYYRWIDSIQGAIIGTGTFFVLYFPIHKFLNNEITIGAVVLIYGLYGGLIDPLFRFVNSMREYYIVMADFESLFEYYRISQEVKDAPHAKHLVITHGKIEFQNVTFKYGKRTIFKNFNLTIPEHKKFALVGHSGSGKSTLVKILYRLYDADDGAILVDGKDIRDIKQESLRSEMSVVPQECMLFDDTIYNNIAFSRPEATRAEVLTAIRFSQLDKIIKEFPKKEETIVGERGVKLSGGEKQRVSIARAILADKKVLVLDEATSSLDSQTEHEIQEDFKKLMKGRTTIIIAHRLSTIMTADIIVVMKRGKIVQMGTHKQLIKQSGEYKKLWNLQKGGYIK